MEDKTLNIFPKPLKEIINKIYTKKINIDNLTEEQINIIENNFDGFLFLINCYDKEDFIEKRKDEIHTKKHIYKMMLSEYFFYKYDYYKELLHDNFLNDKISNKVQKMMQDNFSIFGDIYYSIKQEDSNYNKSLDDYIKSFK